MAGFCKFPVNFPVSREFGAETGSQLTASSATQSGLCGTFISIRTLDDGTAVVNEGDAKQLTYVICLLVGQSLTLGFGLLVERYLKRPSG
jgi:hypothetical protein